MSEKARLLAEFAALGGPIELQLSALATESIGIHAIFGAFLLGAILPHDSLVARTFARHLDAVVTVLLL